MKNLVIPIILLLFAFAASASAAAPENGFGRKRFMEQLKLTDAQKKDFDNLHVDMQKQLVAQRAKIATARIDLRQLFKSDTPDRSAIEKKMSEIADLGVQSRMIRVNTWFAVNKILTPDQQKIWKKALAAAPEMARRAFRFHGHGPMMNHSGNMPGRMQGNMHGGNAPEPQGGQTE